PLLSLSSLSTRRSSDLLLSLPLILVTLGVFILIINALMLKFVGEILRCFEVPGFWRAFFGAIIISIVSWLLSAFFRGSDGRVHVDRMSTRLTPVTSSAR